MWDMGLRIQSAHRRGDKNLRGRERYKLTQYIIDDENDLQISRFDCEYRATRREELTGLLTESGCSSVEWKFPEETGFCQPIVVARK